MDETKFFYPKKIEKILAKSDAICLEIKNVSTDAIGIERLMMSNQKLNSIFTSSQLDSIHDWAERFLYMKPEQFDENFGQVKPFVLLQFILKSSLTENIVSYENRFESYAIENKKQVLGVETADFQLNLFDKMPIAVQIQLIMESLRDFENSRAKFDEMQSIYLSQDLDALLNYVKKESILDNRDLLENRNQNWIPLMEKMMQENVVFFAFGAAHLAGPEGVIELLKTKGYYLTPIKL